MRGKGNTLSLRLTDQQRARLEGAAKMGPYSLSLTEVVVRGIELAAQEIEAKWPKDRAK